MAAPDFELPWERLARFALHPLKVSILEVLSMDGGRMMSPNELQVELQSSLGVVSYHVSELAKAEFLELAKTEPRRGALEHYYRIAGRGNGE